MQSHINLATHLDLHRADAAARQRRAATYRLVHLQDPGRSRRRSLVSGLTAAALALGIVTGAAAHTLGSQPVEQGYEAGLPDGWFAPSESTFVAAADAVATVPSKVRQGYLAGRADGWFDPGAPTVRVAGVVIDRADTVDLVPHNVR